MYQEFPSIFFCHPLSYQSVSFYGYLKKCKNIFSSTFQEVPIRAVNYVKQDSIGVAALICPWNLPLYLVRI
jgi:acyl-CoA reductase-like NAD-dependent aldehyde dehydrogenase